jgi:hypothetical protein
VVGVVAGGAVVGAVAGGAVELGGGGGGAGGAVVVVVATARGGIDVDWDIGMPIAYDAVPSPANSPRSMTTARLASATTLNTGWLTC